MKRLRDGHDSSRHQASASAPDRDRANRNGHLETAGLPICHAAQLEGTTSAQALAVCRDALVGSGTYSARASFPEQATFPAQGHILAFNGLNEGRQVILAHIYGTNPDPGTSVMTFYIHHPAGADGTQLIDNLPASLNHYGYVKRIALTLHRTYTYRGRLHSYLSAACTPLSASRSPSSPSPTSRCALKVE